MKERAKSHHSNQQSKILTQKPNIVALDLSKLSSHFQLSYRKFTTNRNTATTRSTKTFEKPPQPATINKNSQELVKNKFVKEFLTSFYQICQPEL